MAHVFIIRRRFEIDFHIHWNYVNIGPLLLDSRLLGSWSDRKSRLATSEAWERERDFSLPDSARRRLIDSPEHSSLVFIVCLAPNPFWSLHEQYLWKEEKRKPWYLVCAFS